MLGFVLLILAPLIAQLMQLAVSRNRESLADVSAVKMTRYPPGLISALEKLQDDQTVVASALARHRPPLDRATHGAQRRGGQAVPAQPPVRHPPAVGGAHRRAPRAVMRRTTAHPARGGRRSRAGGAGRGLRRRGRGGRAVHPADAAAQLRLHHLHPAAGSRRRTARPCPPWRPRRRPPSHPRCWPLTGLPGADVPRAALPALVVKIDNHREGPSPGRAGAGRRRLRGDRRGHHPVLRGVPLHGRRPRRSGPVGPDHRHRPAAPAAAPAVRLVGCQQRHDQGPP